MTIQTIELAGLHSALHAMRNPLDSWERSDSRTGQVGRKDRELSTKLAKAGPEHAKHLRMVIVWADITAPRYWWQEFDTYRAGVEKLSCSTMHTLMKKPLSCDDFEHDRCKDDVMLMTIASINQDIEYYQTQTDPDVKAAIFRGVVQALPQSFLQKRTVMMSYSALRNIYRQRAGHKLKEWHVFRRWVENLPESWMITDELPREDDD